MRRPLNDLHHRKHRTRGLRKARVGMRNAKRCEEKTGHRNDNTACVTACCSWHDAGRTGEVTHPDARAAANTTGKGARSDIDEKGRHPDRSADSPSTHRGGRPLSRRRELAEIRLDIGALHRVTHHGRRRRRNPIHEPNPPGHNNASTTDPCHESPQLIEFAVGFLRKEGRRARRSI